MFRNRIESSPFVGDVSDDVFEKITSGRSKKGNAYSYNGDLSFISTLRALIYPRIKDTDDTLDFGYAELTGYDAKVIKSINKNVFLDTFMRRMTTCETGSVFIYGIYGDDEESNETLNKVQEYAEELSSWSKLNKISDFYRKVFRIDCYINPTAKSVVIYVDNLDIRKWHYIQVSILAFLPWYFKPEDGISKEEMALIESLRQKDAEKYNQAISVLANQYDLRDIKIDKWLSGFETRQYKLQKEAQINRINQIIAEINALDDKIARCLTEKSECDIKLLGLNAKINDISSSDSELRQYFKCNKKLNLKSVNDNLITFDCWGYLEYFDEDIAKSTIDNQKSFIYNLGGDDPSYIIPNEDIKMLMYALFVEQTLKMRFCSSYSFRLGGRIDCVGNKGYKYDITYNTCMPNPHISYYACMGNYERTINQLLLNGDYIGAIEQCIASCKSLNFGDSVVMERFMRDIYGAHGSQNNNVCIELPDGRVVNPIDAIKYLKEQEVSDNG